MLLRAATGSQSASRNADRSRCAENHCETPVVCWIEGFEPSRTDTMFERESPSCFAGFAGESAGFSTSIDAFRRNHKVTYLCDASASHTLDDMPAHETHRAVCRISGLYGEVYETADWIASTLPRKLGLGKNAGG
jgi:hypothetical protein